MIVKRPRGVYCSTEEREAIRKRAAAAGKSVSRLFLDAGLADDADSRASALTAEEQAELLDGFRTLVAFMRVLRGQAANSGDSASVRGSGVTGNGRDAGRGCRVPVERVRLSISATDEEWAAAHARARRRGLPVSRYLVGLVLPDAAAAGPHADPLPALGGVEQREVLEAVRDMRSLLSGTGDPGAAPAGLRERFAALLDAEGSATVGDGRSGEPRSGPAARHGDEHAGTGTAAPVPGSPIASETPKQSDEVGTGTTPDPKPLEQGALF